MYVLLEVFSRVRRGVWSVGCGCCCSSLDGNILLSLKFQFAQNLRGLEHEHGTLPSSFVRH